MNMNKIIIYIILVLLYLGLSKSLSPSEYGVNYVFNEQTLEKVIGPGPVSVILIDIHSTGFIIKTYYHKYKVVYAFQGYEEIIARTSSSYSSKHTKNIGLSVFRRYEDGKTNHTPLPPGSIFIGDRNFGSWYKNRNGEKIWKFYRAYRHLPSYLGWGKFKPSYRFYQEIQVRMNKEQSFFGFNDEFGIKGELTKSFFPNYFKRQTEKNIDFKKFFNDYLKKNF
jgi:hypothetical protein